MDPATEPSLIPLRAVPFEPFTSPSNPHTQSLTHLDPRLRRHLLSSEAVFNTPLAPQMTRGQIEFATTWLLTWDSLVRREETDVSHQYLPFDMYAPPTTGAEDGDVYGRLDLERAEMKRRRDPRGTWEEALALPHVGMGEESAREGRKVEVDLVRWVVREITPFPDPMWRAILAVKTKMSLADLDQLMYHLRAENQSQTGTTTMEYTLPRVVLVDQGHILELRPGAPGVEICASCGTLWTYLWTDAYFASEVNKKHVELSGGGAGEAADGRGRSATPMQA